MRPARGAARAATPRPRPRRQALSRAGPREYLFLEANRSPRSLPSQGRRRHRSLTPGGGPQSEPRFFASSQTTCAWPGPARLGAG